MKNPGATLLKNRFIVLFTLEWRRGGGRLSIAAAMIALADLYFLVRYGLLAPTTEPFPVLPVFSLPFLAVLFGFEALRNEWKEQTHYLLLSLPVRGRTVIGAKVLALALQLLVLAALAGSVAWWFLNASFPNAAVPFRPSDVAAGFPVWVKLLAATSAFLPLLNLAAAGLLSFLIGQTIGRGRWLLTGLVGFVALWVLIESRVFMLAEQLFQFLPDVNLEPYFAATPIGPVTCDSPEMPCVFDLAWPAMHAVLLAALVWIAAVLWDRKAEV